MSGPSTSIVLGSPLDKQQIAGVRQLVKATSSEVSSDNQEPLELHFWISNANSIGLSYLGQPRPFGLTITDIDYEPMEIKQIEKGFGIIPKQEIILNAFCNQKEDHYILGYLTNVFAKMLGGIIDMNGAISTSLSAPITKQIENGSALGKCIEVEYHIATSQKCTYHIVDVMFFEQWLKDSEFHLLK